MRKKNQTPTTGEITSRSSIWRTRGIITAAQASFGAAVSRIGNQIETKMAWERASRLPQPPQKPPRVASVLAQRRFNKRSSSISPPHILRHAPGLPPQPERRCSFYANILPKMWTQASLLFQTLRLSTSGTDTNKSARRESAIQSLQIFFLNGKYFDPILILQIILKLILLSFICFHSCLWYKDAACYFFYMSLIILIHSNVFSSTYWFVLNSFTEKHSAQWIFMLRPRKRSFVLVSWLKLTYILQLRILANC